MRRYLSLTPSAEADLDAHFIYLSQKADIETALRFDTAAFASFERLCETPFVGSERQYLNTSLKDLRMWFVDGFDRYLIFYRVLDEAILIVRVLHSSRDVNSIMSDETIN